MVSVSFISTISPRRKNAVLSETWLSPAAYIMGNHNNSILVFQLQCQILDFRSRDRGSSALVGSSIRRIIVPPALWRYTVLLLSTGHTLRTLFSRSFVSYPRLPPFSENLPQSHPVRFFTDSVGSRFIGNIIIDTHRKRIRLLEYHAYPFSQQIDIFIWLIGSPSGSRVQVSYILLPDHSFGLRTLTMWISASGTFDKCRISLFPGYAWKSFFSA